jgi:sodium transport system permease protein
MIILSIFLKEFVDLMRDRRALFSGFAYIAFGPIAVLMAVNTIAAQSNEETWAPIRFCEASSPILQQELEAAGLNFKPDAAICITIAPDFEARLQEGRTARVHVRGDLLAQSSTIRRVETVLSRFSSTLGDQRLLTRGVSPSISSPLIIDTQNTNSYTRQADVIARVLIIMFVLSPFFISVAAAADMTAGERERRSIEPLLVHPVSAFSIVLGKWMAAAALGVLGTAACVVGGLYLLEYSQLAQLGIRLETSPATGLLVALYLTPLTLLVASIQVAVGLSSRNFKDAQNYLMLLSFAPAVIGFALTGERLEAASSWPLAWELSALSGPLLGAPSPSVPFAAIAAMELALTALLLLFCARRLRSEAILSHG